MAHTVVIVDDHILLAQAIQELVNGFEGFETLYLCKNGKELLDKLKYANNVPNIILMDINMPIINGIVATKTITETYPDINVLALSVEVDEDIILGMLRAGAKGYLMKDTEKEVLQEALEQVMLHGYYHTNTIAKLLVGSLAKSPSGETLKERELEFIKHACTEMTYKEIAEVMFLSPKTIEGYRDSLYEKLNIKNRIGLILYAIRNNLFVP
ncbi:MAG: response regulator transcription factor [Flavobacteriaceae bacterium]|nr:response regulator transcription factor [Flavobacteriaceae bacterium]